MTWAIAWTSVSRGQVEAGLGVDPGRLEQLLAERAAELGDVAVERPAGLLEQDVADQRVAVGVQPARAPSRRRRHRGGPGRARAGAAASTTPVVAPATSYSSGSIRPGVLGGLAADQRAAGLDAGLGDALDDRRDPLGHDPAAGDVVGHEQRLGAADDQVVDDHADQVEADRVVDVHGLRDRDLGADAVGGGGQDRLACSGSGPRRRTARRSRRATPITSGRRGLLDPDLHQRRWPCRRPRCRRRRRRTRWAARGRGWLGHGRAPSDQGLLSTGSSRAACGEVSEASRRCLPSRLSSGSSIG